MLIVDGGYLAWTYGPEITMHQAWTSGARSAFSKSSGSIICLDAPSNFRTGLFPDYKKDRKLRTLNDPVRQLKHDRVVQFIESHLKPDSSLNTIMINNCEADDLVAMLLMLNRGGRVFGVDKDLLQLPIKFSLQRKDGRITTLKTYAEKVPRTISSCFHEPKDLLLDLCLRGDSSDSIPRLIPPHKLSLLREIFTHPKPFSEAYQIYGMKFVRNLMLAVLPGVYCYEEINLVDLVDLVETGEYWERPLYSDFVDPLKACVERSKKKI